MGVREKYIDAAKRYLDVDSDPGREVRASSVWFEIQPTGMRGVDRWEMIMWVGLEKHETKKIPFHKCRDGCRMILLQRAHAIKAELRKIPVSDLTN